MATRSGEECKRENTHKLSGEGRNPTEVGAHADGAHHPCPSSGESGRTSHLLPGLDFAVAFRAWSPNLGFARWQDYLRVCYIMCVCGGLGRGIESRDRDRNVQGPGPFKIHACSLFAYSRAPPPELSPELLAFRSDLVADTGGVPATTAPSADSLPASLAPRPSAQKRRAPSLEGGV
jgi:hypothetical protein